jgi:hypothetical protein
MNFQFAPALEIANKKLNYTVTYGEGILTPTTPSSTKLITADDNSFYNSLPPPFQPFAYSTSNDSNYCQVEFSPSSKPTSNYCHAVDDDYYNSYASQPYSTTTSTPLVDTPDSIANQFDYDDTYFRFDPEIIEKFSTSRDILNLDTDYVNYDEVNCNSKNQSPCSSPMDPWIISHAMIEPASPKIENTQQQQQHLLPSINQAFSAHFTNLDAQPSASDGALTNNTPDSYDESNILDSFDSTLFDDFGINIKNEEDINAYINPDNYNCVTVVEKPNREFKNIWSENEQKVINNETPKVVKEKKYKKSAKKSEKIVDDFEDEESTPQQLICLWTECYQEFKTQGGLVAHIEKNHVSVAKTLKGDEYTCLWADCPRQYRSFNARYKLLIHMRVHSGEKPNKCPVSCNLN